MLRAILVALASLLIGLTAAAQLSDAQIVRNNFPSALDDGDGVRFSRFVAVDLNRDKQPLLVAVYTNGAGGAIRVLNRAGQVVSAPQIQGMRGFHASVRAIDLDADGTPEIVAEFTTGHTPDNPDTWVFRWASGGLQLISPLCAAGNLKLTCLGRTSFIEPDGDGALALVDWPAFGLAGDTGAVTTSGGWTIYSLKDGAFQKGEESYLFGREFHRAKGAAFTSKASFDAAVGAATLRIVKAAGYEPVTSGHVWLNGSEITKPSDFNRQAKSMSFPVQLGAANEVRVQLEGKPNSGIWVLIEQSAAQQ